MNDYNKLFYSIESKNLFINETKKNLENFLIENKKLKEKKILLEKNIL